jgi:hypothetical protein
MPVPGLSWVRALDRIGRVHDCRAAKSVRVRIDKRTDSLSLHGLGRDQTKDDVQQADCGAKTSDDLRVFLDNIMASNVASYASAQDEHVRPKRLRFPD